MNMMATHSWFEGFCTLLHCRGSPPPESPQHDGADKRKLREGGFHFCHGVCYWKKNSHEIGGAAALLQLITSRISERFSPSGFMSVSLELPIGEKAARPRVIKVLLNTGE